jgi:branched-chain amino acid transport system permease protein
MELFLQFTAIGLCLGTVYALLSVGLILLLRAVGVLNFAQGTILALGGYTFYFIAAKLNIEGVSAIILLVIMLAIFGALFMFSFYWPLRKTKWPQALLIATVGAGTIIQELCLIIVGTNIYMVPPIIPGALRIGEFVLQYQFILVFVVCAVLMVLVYILFDKLYAGRAMSAAAQDKYAAELIGIPTTLTTLVTFVLVFLTTGGYLITPIYFLSMSVAAFQSRAFAGIVIGGFGNIKGAIIGSLVVGLIESYSTYVTTTYKDVIIYMVLIVVLIVKPTGLFAGTRHVAKA